MKEFIFWSIIMTTYPKVYTIKQWIVSGTIKNCFLSVIWVSSLLKMMNRSFETFCFGTPVSVENFLDPLLNRMIILYWNKLVCLVVSSVVLLAEAGLADVRSSDRPRGHSSLQAVHGRPGKLQESHELLPRIHWNSTKQGRTFHRSCVENKIIYKQMKVGKVW